MDLIKCQSEKSGKDVGTPTSIQQPFQMKPGETIQRCILLVPFLHTQDGNNCQSDKKVPIQCCYKKKLDQDLPNVDGHEQ